MVAGTVWLTRFARLIEPSALQFSPKITEKALKLFRASSDNRWGSPMSNDATNIISLDGRRGPGTYAEALLVQSHQKEAAARSAKILNYGCSTRENVICSKTTQGGIVYQSKHNGSDSPLAQPSRKGPAP